MASVPTGSLDPDDDEAALYAGLSHEAAPQLASVHELRTELAAATQERETLESQLQALQAENRSLQGELRDAQGNAEKLASQLQVLQSEMESRQRRFQADLENERTRYANLEVWPRARGGSDRRRCWPPDAPDVAGQAQRREGARRGLRTRGRVGDPFGRW